MSPDAGRRTGKAIVLLSGGIDSAVALFWARAEGWDPIVLSFDYVNRPPAERAATRRLADAAGVRVHETVDLPWMREAADQPPDVRAASPLADAPEGYVPARNLVFYGIAAHYAEVHGARAIVGGHNGGDDATFPDAAPGFFTGLEDVVARGLLTGDRARVRFVMPLKGLTKTEVLETGFKLGVPFAVTWSCYWHDRATPCGACASCRERAGAFRAIGRTDPLA